MHHRLLSLSSSSYKRLAFKIKPPKDR
jgi:hypothetical protein